MSSKDHLISPRDTSRLRAAVSPQKVPPFQAPQFWNGLFSDVWRDPRSSKISPKESLGERETQMAENMDNAIMKQEEQAKSLCRKVDQIYARIIIELKNPKSESFKKSLDSLRDWAKSGALMMLQNAKQAQQEQLATAQELMRSQKVALEMDHRIQVYRLETDARKAADDLAMNNKEAKEPEASTLVGGVEGDTRSAQPSEVSHTLGRSEDHPIWPSSPRSNKPINYSNVLDSPASTISKDYKGSIRIEDTLDREDEIINDFINPQKSGPPTTADEILNFQSWKIRDLEREKEALLERNAFLQARLKGADIDVPGSAGLFEKSVFAKVRRWVSGFPKTESMVSPMVSPISGFGLPRTQGNPLAEELLQATDGGTSMPSTATTWDHKRGFRSPGAHSSASNHARAFALPTIPEVASNKRGSSAASASFRVVRTPLTTGGLHTYPILARFRVPEDYEFLTLEIIIKLLLNLFMAVFEVIIHFLKYLSHLWVEFLQLMKFMGFYLKATQNTVERPRAPGLPTMPKTSFFKLVELFLVIMAIQGIIATTRERNIWFQANGLTREHMLKIWRREPSWMGTSIDGSLTYGFKDVWDTAKWACNSTIVQGANALNTTTHYGATVAGYAEGLWYHYIIGKALEGLMVGGGE
ncbi:Fc.00g042410.m01.CDS01 [Cosmosporella sp. VM-42]